MLMAKPESKFPLLLSTCFSKIFWARRKIEERMEPYFPSQEINSGHFLPPEAETRSGNVDAFVSKRCVMEHQREGCWVGESAAFGVLHLGYCNRGESWTLASGTSAHRTVPSGGSLPQDHRPPSTGEEHLPPVPQALAPTLPCSFLFYDPFLKPWSSF